MADNARLCAEEDCDRPARVACGCGEDAYHGYCDHHLGTKGWIRPGEGECWTHPEYWTIVRRNGWDRDENAGYLVHRILYVYGEPAWKVFDRERGYFVEMTAGKNELPMLCVAWTFTQENIDEEQTEYGAREQELEGFECHQGTSYGGALASRASLFELLPESPDIKSAGKC